MRRVLAKRDIERRQAIRCQEAKRYVALRIQSHFRRKVAFKLFTTMRLNHKATMIQKFMKGLKMF